ncbi:GDSL-type esterase/lipase family protein [Flavobacterium aquiphilum]|uniref:GDSL-type esterase/lipase family protein n=1 Tax=Flavobacterium aquiphilum TaxID=3003261 RepID=UPI0024814167|nr:GDSL-type esterase/lipase family protein [Flavobacterium aquiphilum]
MFKKIVFAITLFLSIHSSAQKVPFYGDIQAFKKEDSLKTPIKNPVLFVGSSSFTKWTHLQQDFPSVPLINRGFGGSTLLDVIRFQNEIIFKYHARKIVIYCGENDIASSEKVTPTEVFNRFKTLYKNIRKQEPNVPIIYISIKPSPSRWQMKERQIETNKLIENYINKNHNIIFVNIWDKMLDANGNPKEDIFGSDRLHMNEKGYQIWIDTLKDKLN